ncbi:hypothetical protein [Streptomyces mirabilis]|uniref:hypothetical protein n=1 Tax=Streptomyces mirabilis TaxID=68239 RepID=UPI0033D4B718
MSMAYLAQADQQQKLEWLDGGVFAVLLDSAATDGQLTVGRFSVTKGEARRTTCTPVRTRSSC